MNAQRTRVFNTGSSSAKPWLPAVRRPRPAEESSAPRSHEPGCYSAPKLKDQDSDPSRRGSVTPFGMGLPRGGQGNRAQVHGDGEVQETCHVRSHCSYCLPGRKPSSTTTIGLRTSGHSQHPCRACRCPLPQMKYQVSQARQGSTSIQTQSSLLRPFPLPRAAPRCRRGPCPGHPPAQCHRLSLRPGLASRKR